MVEVKMLDTGTIDQQVEDEHQKLRNLTLSDVIGNGFMVTLQNGVGFYDLDLDPVPRKPPERHHAQAASLHRQAEQFYFIALSCGYKPPYTFFSFDDKERLEVMELYIEQIFDGTNPINHNGSNAYIFAWVDSHSNEFSRIYDNMLDFKAYVADSLSGQLAVANPNAVKSDDSWDIKHTLKVSEIIRQNDDKIESAFYRACDAATKRLCNGVSYIDHLVRRPAA